METCKDLRKNKEGDGRLEKLGQVRKRAGKVHLSVCIKQHGFKF